MWLFYIQFAEGQTVCVCYYSWKVTHIFVRLFFFNPVCRGSDCCLFTDCCVSSHPQGNCWDPPSGSHLSCTVNYMHWILCGGLPQAAQENARLPQRLLWLQIVAVKLCCIVFPLESIFMYMQCIITCHTVSCKKNSGEEKDELIFYLNIFLLRAIFGRMFTFLT